MIDVPFWFMTVAFPAFLLATFVLGLGSLLRRSRQHKQWEEAGDRVVNAALAQIRKLPTHQEFCCMVSDAAERFGELNTQDEERDGTGYYRFASNVKRAVVEQGLPSSGDSFDAIVNAVVAWRSNSDPVELIDRAYELLERDWNRSFANPAADLETLSE